MNIKDYMVNKEMEMAKIIFAERPTSLEAMAAAIKKANEMAEKYDYAIEKVEELCKKRLDAQYLIKQDFEKVALLNKFKDSKLFGYLKLYYAGKINIFQLLKAMEAEKTDYSVEFTTDMRRVRVGGKFWYENGNFNIDEDMKRVTDRIAANLAVTEEYVAGVISLEELGIVTPEMFREVAANFEKTWTPPKKETK